MKLREGLGLLLTVVGVALVPLGWMVSAKIYLLSCLLVGAGVLLFYTEQRRAREERVERERVGGGTGTGVPGDAHNYSGWQTDGRRQPLDSISESGGGDGD
jgi:hypothetical protein